MLRNNTLSLIAGILLGALITIVIAPSFISIKEQDHSIFVYGTLRNNLIRFYACHCIVGETPVVLQGYQRTGLNIVPSEKVSVKGSFINVTESQLSLIDKYENVPEHYTREKISIGEKEYWVYIKVDD
jgi:gamma-glutamylcyclotransferase (GGCT)/AIG2-like uncharacterized protein YtfP